MTERPQRTATTPTAAQPERQGPIRRGLRLFLLAAAGLATVIAGAVLSAVLMGVPRGESAGSGTTPTPLAASPLMSPSGRPTEPAASPIVPSASPSSTPLPSGPAPLDWAEGTPPDGTVNTVEWVGDRWLAAGQIGIGAATWSSTDGLTWTPGAPVPPEPIRQTPDGEPGTGYWVTEVTRLRGELLAFGWNRIGCCDGGKPMAWRSADGSAWSVVATEGTAFDTYQFPTSAAMAPDGSLVLASAIGLGSGAAVFTTSDLLGWEQHQLTPPGSFEGVSAVAAAPTMLMAVGFGHEDDDDRTHQRAWISPDGRTWAPIAPPSEVGTLSGVAWDPVRQRFLVSGQDDQLRAVVWLTGDGVSWTSVRLSSGEGMAQDVDVVEGLLVAIGTEGRPEQSRMMVWSSLDGTTWQIADLGPSNNGMPLGAAGTNGAVVLLNGVGPAPDYAPTLTVWRGTR